jgi:hypothetical protein
LTTHNRSVSSQSVFLAIVLAIDFSSFPATPHPRSIVFVPLSPILIAPAYTCGSAT